MITPPPSPPPMVASPFPSPSPSPTATPTLAPAGSVPTTLTLDVTGSPIDPSWLATQIAASIVRSVTAQPGAQVSVAPFPSPSPPLPGSSSVIDVPLAIAGNGYADVETTTAITVNNLPLDPFAPPLLLYDDDPEKVVADGLLYRGTVTAQTPARLYYYHDGGAQPHAIAVVLSANVPSRVQVIDASAGPNLDVMSVGHAVSKDFMEMDPVNEGLVLDVQPNVPYALHEFALTQGTGIAGSIALQVDSGGPVTVSVVAAPSGTDPLSMLDAPPVPGDGHHRTGVFDVLDYGTESLAYAVGGPDAKTTYGDRDATPPSADPDATGHDYGDYGVERTLLFSLSNPTASPATVYLYERPIGGIVRSSFLVDGAVREVGCVRLPVPYEIAAFELAPGGRYQVTVGTMTDGGSNYPLEVGMTGTPPQPTAPPIASPEGCFPKTGP